MSQVLENSLLITQQTKAKMINRQSPQEIIPPCSLRGFLTNIIGTLALLILVNFLAVWYLGNYPWNRGYWLVEKKWKLLLSMKEPVDSLILGDSSCNQGVIPKVLEKGLGGRAVNLATIDNMLLLNNVWMLKSYLERFDPPQNVLLVYGSEVWRHKLNPVLLEKIPLEWGFWKRSQPQLKLSTEDRINMFLCRYAPLYAENESLYSLIAQGFRRPWTLFKPRFRLEEDGYMRWDSPSPVSVEGHTKYLIQITEESQFEPSEINLQALEQIIALADRYEINIYIVNGPMYEGLYQDESFQAYYGQIRKMLKSYTDRSQLVHYIDKSVTFPIDQMENANHVIYSAAQFYTETLVKEILAIRQKVERIQ